MVMVVDTEHYSQVYNKINGCNTFVVKKANSKNVRQYSAFLQLVSYLEVRESINYYIEICRKIYIITLNN